MFKRITYLSILWIALIFSTSLSAQCLEGDCRQGEGIMVLSGGKRYVGQFANGEMSGQGALYHSDGSRYIGEFMYGMPHGKGMFIDASGNKQQGIWYRGKLSTETFAETASPTTEQTGCIAGDCENGSGTYVFQGGAIYNGEFRQGEIHGRGICYYPDGSQYRGNWTRRYPDGQGVKTWPDGRSHSGLWRMGRPVDARGQFIDLNDPELYSNPVVQTGCLRGNCEHGQGYFAYADGSLYDGFFSQGRPHGHGKFVYPNGDEYTGSFRQGLQHGQGTLTYADGRKQQGEWIEGTYQQQVYVQSNPQIGCQTGNCKDGFGTYVFRDQSRYEGSFRNGLPEGNGVVVYSNRDRYEGNFARGAFNGYGSFYQFEGPTIRGYWVDGRHVGAPAIAATPSAQDRPATTNSQEMPKVWALVIGVANYRHMPVLRYTDDDAYRLYAFLKSPEGGAIPDEQMIVLIDEDATRNNILRHMRDLFGKAGPNDLVLLYFSGHGLQGAFLPIDYDGHNNQLFHSDIKRLLDGSTAKYQLILADACHSGSLFASRGRHEEPLSKYYETLARSKSGAALIMSSKSEETSLESGYLRQGVFSHFLIRGLKGQANTDGDSIVNVQELFQYVYENVRNYTRNQQSPVLEGDFDPKMPVSSVVR